MNESSYTLKINESSLKKERCYDFIYDPLYTISSNKDYDRVLYRSRINKQKIYPAPIFPNMFSELVHYPKIEFLTNDNNTFPTQMSKANYGYNQKNADRAIFENTNAGGKDRTKFFKRPILPAYPSTPMIIDSMYPPIGRDIEPSKIVLKDQHFNAGVQTDYRENDAQTDPYTPDFVFKDSETKPEILSLIYLKHGHGLPAGLMEIEAIERARERKEWEKSLPPLNNTRLHKKRMKIMEEMEEKDYQYRDAEIEKFHKRKLDAMVEHLNKRNLNTEQHDTQTINKKWLNKQAQKKKLEEKLNNRYLRDIRKMQVLYSSKPIKTDIIEKYSNLGSTVFAPMTRLGVFPDANNHSNLGVDKYYNSVKCLTEIEHKLAENKKIMKQVSFKDQYTSMGFLKRKFKEKKELDDIYQSLKNNYKTKSSEAELRMLIKITKEPERPVTPVAESKEEIEEWTEESSLIITKTLRGKFYQKEFLREKYANWELLKEIKSTNGISKESIKANNENLKKILDLQRSRETENIAENKLNGIIKSIEGSIVGETNDYLAKELIRLQDEQRIKNYVNIAENERLKREAEEAGTRQIEERRRIEEQDIFKQIIYVHQQTTLQYLEDMIEETIDRLVNEESIAYVKEVGNIVDEEAHYFEPRRDEQMTQEIVAKMVHEFLFPEVQKHCTRLNTENNQNKYLNTSKSAFIDLKKN